CLSSCYLFMMPRAPESTLFPYTTLFRSRRADDLRRANGARAVHRRPPERARYADLRGRRRGLGRAAAARRSDEAAARGAEALARSEEHTSELQSRENLVCRLLLEKKN